MKVVRSLLALLFVDAATLACAWLSRTTTTSIHQSNVAFHCIPNPKTFRKSTSLEAALSTVDASALLLAEVNKTSVGLYHRLLDAAAESTQASYRLIGTRTIGVDYGVVRTGVAASVGYQPKALAIIKDLNNTQVCQRIIQFARAEQASRIVVGLPLHKNGTVAEQTNITLVFAEELTRAVLAEMGPDVSVLLWDERYTSKEAAARAHAKDPDSFLYATLDADAASIILEHYFNENGQGALSLELDDATREQCLQEFRERQREVAKRLEQIALERAALLLKRQETIARQKALQLEMQPENEGKKKKKKKKRKR